MEHWHWKTTLIEKITSLQNPRIKKAIRLHSSRGRQSQGRIIVFGMREVTRALDTGFEPDEVYFSESMPPEEVAELRTKSAVANARQSVLASAVFEKLAYGDRADGVVAVGQRPQTDIKNLSLTEPLLVVVAQGIEKPGNLGAIIRTADACAASAVLLADPLTDFFHPNSIRASTASVFGMALATGSSEEIQHWLDKNQIRVFTAMLDNASDCFEADLKGNVAIVVGNEANGLSNQWSKPEYSSIRLPMKGVADSLNVSVTASVMIYEATRQRQG